MTMMDWWEGLLPEEEEEETELDEADLEP